MTIESRAMGKIIEGESMNDITVYEPQPVMTVEEMANRWGTMVSLATSVLKEGIHYGLIPGTQKKTLYKPGAEMLTTFFGLSVRFVVIESQIDWETGLFYFHYRCQLHKNSHLVSEGDGSCNSYESKYRWRWIPEAQVPTADKEQYLRRDGTVEEFTFAVDQAKTTGQYGKPAEYWQVFKSAIADGTAIAGKKKTRKGEMYDTWTVPGIQYRVPNPDIADIVNTVMKMAEKRALIAATLVGVAASEFFTQDMEEAMEELRQTKRDLFYDWAREAYDLDRSETVEALRSTGYTGGYDVEFDLQLRDMVREAMGDAEEREGD